MENKKCSKCKIYKSESYFIKKDRILKTCIKCRENNKKYRDKFPVETKIQNWISHSKNTDKFYNRFDSEGFIDKIFLNKLVNDYKNCYYCKIKLQYSKSNNTLATIERLDNKKGHTKNNCVLACRQCNFTKVGHKCSKVVKNKDDKCPRCRCIRTENDFYKNGKLMKTCDLCRNFNKTYYEKCKNQKRCLKCNVFKDKDKFIVRKITYDLCRVCIFTSK